MDTSDPNIHFNSEGICNHCIRYDNEISIRVDKGLDAEFKLKQIVNKIKLSGLKNDYDCIIGLSGGVDSSYVAYLVKKLGLRPLAVHFDNGWNSDLAVSNIKKIIDILEIDLYTFVIDWEEFSSLQRSFLMASTPDAEIPTDHAISALLFREASKRGINYIISGMNFSTESISVEGWSYGHSDWKYIKSIHKIFGDKRIKNYPHFSFSDLFYWTFIKRIKSVSILNYINYDKSQAINLLVSKLGWVNYGGKHYESVYTRFYQGYYLPIKFKIDKRRAHLSDLINSKQLTRDEALKEINDNSYLLSNSNNDLSFVQKKLGYNEFEFKKVLELPIKTFSNYPNNYFWIRIIKKFIKFLRANGMYAK